MQLSVLALQLPVKTKMRQRDGKDAAQKIAKAGVLNGPLPAIAVAQKADAAKKLAIVGDGHADCRFDSTGEKQGFLRAFGHGRGIGNAQAFALFKQAQHRRHVVERCRWHICRCTANARPPDYRGRPLIIVKFYKRHLLTVQGFANTGHGCSEKRLFADVQKG